jgi:heme exporter protein C
LLYAGIFLVRGSVEDAHRRARMAALLAILAVADVPLVLMATRWFRGVHPVSPEMDQRMRLVLLVAAISFTALFAFMTYQRRRQLELAEQVATLEQAAAPGRTLCENMPAGLAESSL